MAAIQSKQASSTRMTGRPYGRRSSDRQPATLAKILRATGQHPGQYALPFALERDELPGSQLTGSPLTGPQLTMDVKRRRRRVGPRPLAAPAQGNDWSAALLTAYVPATIVLSAELEVQATIGAAIADYLRSSHWHRGERVDALLATDLLPHFMRLCRRGEPQSSTLVTRTNGRRVRMWLRVERCGANGSEQPYSYLSFEPLSFEPLSFETVAAAPIDSVSLTTPTFAMRNALRKVERAESQRTAAYRVGEPDSSLTALEQLSTQLHASNVHLTQSNAALATLNDELNAQLMLRNDKLEQSATLLQISRDDAELALQQQRVSQMEAVDQLCGGVAHEFNNILASIMGYADLLARVLHDAAFGEAAPATQQRYVVEILRASERARSLVQQLLLYGQRGNSQLRPTMPGRLLNELAPKLRATLPVAIELDVECSAALPSANIDAAQITLALMCVVENARDAIQSRADELSRGRIDLRVSNSTLDTQRCASCQRSFEGAYLQLAVHDSGPGVAEADLTKLFEPFFTTKEMGKGKGLGLSMAHGIVHAHGGHITVQSSPDGASISLLLPAAS